MARRRRGLNGQEQRPGEEVCPPDGTDSKGTGPQERRLMFGNKDFDPGSAWDAGVFEEERRAVVKALTVKIRSSI